MDAYVFIFLAIVILSTINCVIRIFQSRRGDSMVLQNLFSSSAEWFHCFKHCLSWHSMAAINTDLIFLFIINMQYEEKSEILLLKDLSSVLAYMIDFYHLFYFLTTRFSCFFFLWIFTYVHWSKGFFIHFPPWKSTWWEWKRLSVPLEPIKTNLGCQLALLVKHLPHAQQRPRVWIRPAVVFDSKYIIFRFWFVGQVEQGISIKHAWIWGIIQDIFYIFY